MESETGKTERTVFCWRVQSTEVEEARGIEDGAGTAPRYLVDLYFVLKNEPAMKELHLERQIFTAPKRGFRLEADAAVLIVAKIGKRLRQRFFWSLVRALSKLPSHLPNLLRIEFRILDLLCMSGLVPSHRAQE